MARVRRHLVYVLYRNVIHSMVQSQVITPLAFLRERGWEIRLLAFRSPREFLRADDRLAWRRFLEETQERLQGRVDVLPATPARFPYRWARQIVRYAIQRRVKNEPALVQCCGPVASALALDVVNDMNSVRTIAEMWGLYGHELVYEEGFDPEVEVPGRLRPAFVERTELEKRVVAGADGVIFVSEAMRRYFEALAHIDRTKSRIRPCCVNPAPYVDARKKREETRASLGLTGRCVLVYCGTLHRWQCPDETLRLFRQIHTELPNAHLLVLSPSADRMAELADQAGVPPDCLTTRCVPHEEVPRYLAAADAGFLIREASIVNRVASPIKFAEYLAAGLPVIISEGVGDYSRFVQDRRVGYVLKDNTGNAEALTSWLKQWLTTAERGRRQCVDAMEENLSWPVQMDALSDFYDELL